VERRIPASSNGDAGTRQPAVFPARKPELGPTTPPGTTSPTGACASAMSLSAEVAELTLGSTRLIWWPARCRQGSARDHSSRNNCLGMSPVMKPNLSPAISQRRALAIDSGVPPLDRPAPPSALGSSTPPLR
jgi:hypothetical protein